MKCFVILPCYNEERNLNSIIYKINETLQNFMTYKIIAVNDGSLDSTGNLLRELSFKYPIITTEHKVNKGLSEALLTGLSIALEHSSDEDFIITMDSDNTHHPKYILKMLSEAMNGAKIVVGSRYIPNGRQINVPPHRVLLSKTINLLLRKMAKIPVKDVTSGYRCFKASAIRKLKERRQKFLESKGFEVSFELLAKTFWCSSSIKEVPIMLDYSKKKGKSKMKILPTIVGYCTVLTKIRSWRKQMEEDSNENIDSL